MIGIDEEVGMLFEEWRLHFFIGDEGFSLGVNLWKY